MNTSAGTRPREAVVSAYERLRGGCLEASPRLGGELGLSVLLRHGMLAWTRAWAPPRATQPPAAVRLDAARLPCAHEDIIAVMVAMAIARARSRPIGALPA